MNFKHKLWWAQHKNEVYKYGTILSLVLIVTISIIYFTYSKFSSTNEATAYETTVEPFIKNDYFIASYIDGEWSDTIPGKDDGYVVDKIVCDNGATATWNNEEWGINIRNATQKIKCNVYFKERDIVINLSQGLIPVTYDDSGNVVVADSSSDDWYSYKEHKWANAVLVKVSDSTIKSKYFNDDMSLKSSAIGQTISLSEIMQMYVYIPRYRYKLFNVEGNTISEQAIEIEFENKSVAKSTGTKNGEWLTHPAFTFDNKELDGIWIGKFETTGTAALPTIKPTSISLRNMNVSSQFDTSRLTTTTLTNVYGTSTTSDSHITKNAEWGAVAYLSSSIYGRYNDSITCIDSGCEVWINNNSNYKTGCGGSSSSASESSSCNVWTTTNGLNASTTGNIYGIYDMNGGAAEYVMCSSEIGKSGFSTLPDSKYYDHCTSDLSDYGLGESIGETIGWYGDLHGLLTTTGTWLMRGSGYWLASQAGIFSFGINSGTSIESGSFRMVLVN